MKYMLLIYGNHDSWDALTGERYDAVMRAHEELLAELTASGDLAGNAA